MKRSLISIFAVFILSGCFAQSLNVYNAEFHSRAGYIAMDKGDWEGAMRQFAQAVVNADLGDADPKGKILVNYEYGRSLGVICIYDKSEETLLRSKKLSEQLGESTYLQLLELFLLNEKQSRYKVAEDYFFQLIPEIQKEKIQEKYPLGVADVYKKYAAILEKSGRVAEASEWYKKANSIYSANPNAKPFGNPTPYGTQCVKN